VCIRLKYKKITRAHWCFLHFSIYNASHRRKYVPGEIVRIFVILFFSVVCALCTYNNILLYLFFLIYQGQHFDLGQEKGIAVICCKIKSKRTRTQNITITTCMYSEQKGYITVNRNGFSLFINLCLFFILQRDSGFTHTCIRIYEMNSIDH